MTKGLAQVGSAAQPRASGSQGTPCLTPAPLHPCATLCCAVQRGTARPKPDGFAQETPSGLPCAEQPGRSFQVGSPAPQCPCSCPCQVPVGTARSGHKGLQEVVEQAPAPARLPCGGHRAPAQPARRPGTGELQSNLSDLHPPAPRVAQDLFHHLEKSIYCQ